MNQIRGWLGFEFGALGAFAVLALGCGSVEELKKACIPGVDCTAINTIEAPPNCSPCADCQDDWGSCTPSGLACKGGLLDLEPSIAGCESLTSDARAQWVMHSTTSAASYLSFNDDLLQLQMTVSVLAYGEDDPSCVPTLTMSCGYTVQAMQLEIPDFDVPESSWNGGVATLNGPVVASDDGTGASVLAPMQFAFEVRQGSERRVALSTALVSFRVTRDSTDPRRASILIQANSVDFGGYKLTELLLNSELTSD